MATTWTKRTLTVHLPNDAMLATVPIYLLEASSQTFLAGSPVVFSSGYMAVASDAVTTLAGFAMEDGHNITAGTQKIKIVPCAVGNCVQLFGNFLTTAAADNVLAATDLGITAQLNYEAAGGSAGEAIWHFGDTQSSEGVQVINFKSDVASLPANSSVVEPTAGDTNARVLAQVLDSAADFAV